MLRIAALFAVVLAVFITTNVSASEVATDHSLTGEVRSSPSDNRSDHATDLFRGDLGAEIDIGCSNTAGTSGGPNDVAVCVVAPIAVPFDITDHFYHIGTTVSPTITSLTFKVWGAGPTPGAVIGSMSGLDFSSGDHTVAITPHITVESSRFYFGQSQPQTSAGIRWGVDTSSGSVTHSFIKAPGCGLSAWGSLDSIGFPGNWVMAVSVGSEVPIELQDHGESCGLPTPVVDASWGQVKAKTW